MLGKFEVLNFQGWLILKIIFSSRHDHLATTNKIKNIIDVVKILRLLEIHETAYLIFLI